MKKSFDINKPEFMVNAIPSTKRYLSIYQSVLHHVAKPNQLKQDNMRRFALISRQLTCNVCDKYFINQCTAKRHYLIHYTDRHAFI